MKRAATFASAALILAAGHTVALSENTMTSGRPHAILNTAQCDEVWHNAVPAGDTLARAQASPFIVNFQQIDADGDGTISISEFKAGCKKGLVKYTQHQRRQPDRG